MITTGSIVKKKTKNRLFKSSGMLRRFDFWIFNDIPTEGGNTVLRNVGKSLPVDTA